MSNLKFNWNGKIREYNTIQEFLRDTAIFSFHTKAWCDFEAGFGFDAYIAHLPEGVVMSLNDGGDGATVLVKPMLEFFAKAAPEMLIEALKKENAL